MVIVAVVLVVSGFVLFLVLRSAGRSHGSQTQTLVLPGDVPLEMVRIRAGTFVMGSPESEKLRNRDEQQHMVTLTQCFWLGKYPVTQAQWEAVMGDNPSEFKGDGACPVERVSWDDANRFIRAINTVLPGYEFRLPTEAEWEYACRAGTRTPCHWGHETRDSLVDGFLWHRPNSQGRTHPVGQKRPNRWGLHDMLGNVWEWCADWYKWDYGTRNVRDPKGPASPPGRRVRCGLYVGEETSVVTLDDGFSRITPEQCAKTWTEVIGNDRVVRGGGFDWPNCRSAVRNKRNPALRMNDAGFRLAMSFPPDQTGSRPGQTSC